MRYTLINKNKDFLHVAIHTITEENKTFLERAAGAELYEGEYKKLESVVDEVMVRFAPGKKSKIFDLSKAGDGFLMEVQIKNE